MPLALEENGLLPGRGPRGPGLGPRSPPGRGAPPPAAGPGVGRGPGAGRGPGLGPGPGRGPDGADWPPPLGPPLAAGALGAAGRGASGRGAGAGGAAGRAGASLWGAGCGVGCGMGTGRGAGRGPGFGIGRLPKSEGDAGAGAPLPAWSLPTGRGAGRGAGRGDLPPLESPLPNASVSLRTTGASIVEDADRTNSPISVSLAMTTLLSTPNSLASSYTRTFATALPNSAREAVPPDRRYLDVLIAACSSGAHSNLTPPINSASYETVGNHSPGGFPRQVLQVGPQARLIERSLRAESAGERPATICELQAGQGGVQ